ncbi:MAG: beta-galactosidase [Armatimonadota bacterium]
MNFYKPEIIRYDKKCFNVNNSNLLLYSGSFHYFRCPQLMWRDRLVKLKQAGYNCIETYIPWNWHEQKENLFDFTDLEGFLKLCSLMGFYIIARPGPYVCTELDSGGFPGWLLEKCPEYRTDSEENIKWAEHWLREVMPVINKYQITDEKGAVILVQIENEYDYSSIPDESKKKYLDALYDIAMSTGTKVPIITCRTKEAKDKNNEKMSQVMDTLTFYPGWNNLDHEVKRVISLQRNEQPDAPVMIVELQGGWFSSLSAISYFNDLGANHINKITKLSWANGCTATNHYMAFGGTNFAWWPGKGIYTSYDYQAPLAEHGGLTDKYYSVKLMGDACNLMGGLIAVSEPVGKVKSNTKFVDVYQRNSGQVGFVFVSNKSNEYVKANITVSDPITARPMDINVDLLPNAVKILPLNYPVGSSFITSTNAELLNVAKIGTKTFVFLYSDCHSFDDEIEVNLFTGVRRKIRLPIKDTESVKVVDDLVFIGLNRHIAQRTWRAFHGMVMTNAALLVPTGLNSALVLTKPGKTTIKLITSTTPKQINLSGKKQEVKYNPKTKISDFQITTPQIPASSNIIRDIYEIKTEFDNGCWTKIDKLNSLERLGYFDRGYYRYRARIDADGLGYLFVGGSDAYKTTVFVNGKLVKNTYSSAMLHKIGNKGSVDLGILYENRGKEHSGDGISEQSGITDILFVPKKSCREIKLSKAFIRSSDRFPDKSHPWASDTENFDGAAEIYLNDNRINNFDGKRSYCWYSFIVDINDKKLGAGVFFKNLSSSSKMYVNGIYCGQSFFAGENAFNITRAIKTGRNVITVAVPINGEVNGIYDISLILADVNAKIIDNVEIVRGLPGEDVPIWKYNLAEEDCWKNIKLNSRTIYKDSEKMPINESVCWYRTNFNLPDVEGWQIPWKLKLDMAGDALIFVNDVHIGLYYDLGIQKEFYVPECWLNYGDVKNVLSIAAVASNNRPEIKSIEITPYFEYSLKINDLKLEF